MAGYLFQPERALHHLAISPRGSQVGIETLDDVAVIFPEGQRLLEQDKHYTSDKRPLADRSKEFWNSLKVWLDALKNEELDIKSTRFHLVTNGVLKDGLVFDLMNRRTGGETPMAFVEKLRRAGQNPPGKLKSLYEDVLSNNDDILAGLIAQIEVFDSTVAATATP